MQRPLKFHEQKLLKKVDFLAWKNERNIREIKVLRRYLIQDREDYTKCVASELARGVWEGGALGRAVECVCAPKRLPVCLVL